MAGSPNGAPPCAAAPAARRPAIWLARRATSPALRGRAAGLLAVSSSTSAATSAGTCPGSGGSGRSRCASATASAGPVNGGAPVRHS